ncbi:MAG: uL15 family ribosomal protein [Candidatus Aenigmatarchaeota archaeon]|nr:50S ribosomal protein L15 [Candidatus Aenigmarchaeota archaeon]
MTARFRKKVRRMRGTHTHGWGAKKKHRGGGSQAGKGRSGMMKHKKSWMITNEPQHYGKHGFKLPLKARTVTRAITLRDLDNIARRLGKSEIDAGELGFDKVLGTGKLTQPLTVKADIIVESAKAKIESAGGKAILKTKME